MGVPYCAVCGWQLAESADKGCVRGNCSMRPVPEFWTDPDRALAEGYSLEAVERHRRPPPEPCPNCVRLESALASERARADKLGTAAGCSTANLRPRGRICGRRDLHPHGWPSLKPGALPPESYSGASAFRHAHIRGPRGGPSPLGPSSS